MRVRAHRLLVGRRQLAHQRVGREQQARDTRRVLQRDTNHLLGIDDTRLDQVLVLLGGGVVAVVLVRVAADVLNDDRAVLAGVGRDLADRGFEGAADDHRADLLVAGQLHLLDHVDAVEESDAATGDDAFFDGRAGCVEGVLDAGLLLLHLGLGRSADVDLSDTTGELGETSWYTLNAMPINSTYVGKVFVARDFWAKSLIRS